VVLDPEDDAFALVWFVNLAWLWVGFWSCII